MKVTYQLYEIKNEKRVIALRCGWSWPAFLVTPLWATKHGFPFAAAASSILALSFIAAAAFGHDAAFTLIAFLLLFNGWVGSDGNRWLARKVVAQYGSGNIGHIGGSAAKSSTAAEAEGRESIEIRDRFIQTALKQKPEHLV